MAGKGFGGFSRTARAGADQTTASETRGLGSQPVPSIAAAVIGARSDGADSERGSRHRLRFVGGSTASRLTARDRTSSVRHELSSKASVRAHLRRLVMARGARVATTDAARRESLRTRRRDAGSVAGVSGGRPGKSSIGDAPSADVGVLRIRGSRAHIRGGTTRSGRTRPPRVVSGAALGVAPPPAGGEDQAWRGPRSGGGLGGEYISSSSASGRIDHSSGERASAISAFGVHELSSSSSSRGDMIGN